MNEIEIIDLPKIHDRKGNLSFIEGNSHIPFAIKRCYWIYDVPGGEVRGGHAFIQQQEFIVAISGSFDVIIDDGNEKTKHHLNRSSKGLYIPGGYWRHMENFSTNSIALVLASTLFDENDYIRDYKEYCNAIELKRPYVNKSSIVQRNTLKLDDKFNYSFMNLNKLHHEKGNITVIEGFKDVPFKINRVYYLYDVPGGETRGGHAHKELYQLLIATGGSFDVVLDDGKEKNVVSLNRPYQALYIMPGTWRELVNFSSGATCLVLASLKYDESDYIRDYDSFINYITNNK